jgi:hypothetical protein
MVELGEDLPLVTKAAEYQVRIHSALHQLQRYLVVKFSIVARREVDGSHSSSSNLPQQPIRADSRSGARGICGH